MAEVHKELSTLLVPDIIPRSQGQSFKCKTVKRKYAFEHGEIPRRETEYLKVVYTARHGYPSVKQCLGMYIYIYIHTYLHVYIYTYIYIYI
jgi:hypothetical protein